jgi:hypothetical protein
MMHELCTTMVRKACPPGRGQKFENIAIRAGANGARIRNLLAESFRNQVSVLILVHKNAMSRAGVGNYFRKSFRCRLECGVVATKGTNYA